MYEATLADLERQREELEKEIDQKSERLANLNRAILSLRMVIKGQEKVEELISRLEVPGSEGIEIWPDVPRRSANDPGRAFTATAVKFYRNLIRDRFEGIATATMADRIARAHFCDRLSVYDMLTGRTWRLAGEGVQLSNGALDDYIARKEAVRREVGG